VPIALYLLGLALVMVITGRSLGGRRVRPKWIGAAAILVIGAVAPLGLAVLGCAAVLALMVLRMVLSEPPTQPASAAAVSDVTSV
jgi:hypothetical protein